MTIRQKTRSTGHGMRSRRGGLKAQFESCGARTLAIMRFAQSAERTRTADTGSAIFTRRTAPASRCARRNARTFICIERTSLTSTVHNRRGPAPKLHGSGRDNETAPPRSVGHHYRPRRGGQRNRVGLRLITGWPDLICRGGAKYAHRFTSHAQHPHFVLHAS